MTGVRARGLRYDVGERTLFEGVALTVAGGESLAVVGPSGSGKTSLLALLAHLAEPAAGQVEVTGSIGIVLQGHGLVSLLTAVENVEAALRAGGCAPPEAGARALVALDELGLESHADQLTEELSGGQQQRVAVARALALMPDVLIADEPTAEQDRAARALLLSRLFEVPGRGGALVLATHDPAVAERCDRILDLAACQRFDAAC